MANMQSKTDSSCFEGQYSDDPEMKAGAGAFTEEEEERSAQRACAAAQQRQKKYHRFEDVFQDEVIPSFRSTESFIQFARSSNGLGLSDYVIKTSEENYRHSVDAFKMDLLNKWKECKGRKCDCEKILEIVENYFKSKE